MEISTGDLIGAQAALSKNKSMGGGIVMQTYSRRAVGRTAAGLALSLFLASPAAAQAVGGIDPATLDLAGVRLGMSVNDAIAALKKFDGKYAITKQYYAQPLFTFANLEAKELKDIPKPDQRFAFFYSLSVVKTEMKKECQWLDDPYASQNHNVCTMEPHAIETVMVWFSPTPGQEHVIAVQRKVPFEKDPLPAIVSLKNGIFAKYPKDQVTYQSDEAYGVCFDWLFDSQRRILSEASAARKNRHATNGELPRNAYAGDGLALSVAFAPNRQNCSLADSMSITLYDGNALYRSTEQAQATYKALKAKADAEDVSHSKGQNQPKF